MDWVPYAEREEWSDVKPIPQDDGPASVVRIRYSEQFIEVMGYLRYVLQNDEMSDRAMDVTDDAINLNAANYTAWHFRRKLIVALKRDLKKEMEYTMEMALENPKNYQIWHHRRCICELLNDGSMEHEFTATAFDQDSKNYHAWSHRQWAVKHFGLWDGELEYLDKLLDDDVRNNSAWSQRHFVISNTFGGRLGEAVGQEISFAQGRIRKTPFNDSAWNYYKSWTMQESSSWGDTVIFCDEILGQDLTCWQAMDLLVNVLKAQGGEENIARAAKICDELATKYDTIRVRYWNFFKNELQAA